MPRLAVLHRVLLRLLLFIHVACGEDVHANLSWVQISDGLNTWVTMQSNSSSIAIASTVLNPDESFPTWLDYHLRRVQHILIYMDDPNERPTFESMCEGKAVTIFEGAQVGNHLTPESRIMIRQDANMKHAISHLLEREYTWLLHIDVDELLYETGQASTDWTESPSDIGMVKFINHEAQPVNYETSNPFRDCEYFWVNGFNRNKYFIAYGNGKTAVRLTPGVEPNGPHYFRGYEGSVFTPPPNQVMILHYPTPSYASWKKKYTYYGDFPDYWFNNKDSPIHVKFMTQSRDVVQKALKTGNWEKAKAFFDKRMLSLELRDQAISEGKLRRYRPLVDSGLVTEPRD